CNLWVSINNQCTPPWDCLRSSLRGKVHKSCLRVALFNSRKLYVRTLSHHYLSSSACAGWGSARYRHFRSEEHTSELQSRFDLVYLHSFPTRRSSDLL